MFLWGLSIFRNRPGKNNFCRTLLKPVIKKSRKNSKTCQEKPFKIFLTRCWIQISNFQLTQYSSHLNYRKSTRSRSIYRSNSCDHGLPKTPGITTISFSQIGYESNAGEVTSKTQKHNHIKFRAVYWARERRTVRANFSSLYVGPWQVSLSPIN